VADPATWAAGPALLAIRECLDTFPEITFTVSGHCMGPALLQGDRVFVRKLGEAGARVGDIVLVRSEGRLLLHRLVVGGRLAKLTRGHRTMADRARFLDPPVQPAEILGRVVSRDGLPLPGKRLTALRSLARAVRLRLRLVPSGSR
jgi:signal peptidase I